MADPVVNTVRISGPKTGDHVCPNFTAGGTFSGVSSVTVTFAGQSRTAELDSARGVWKATFSDVAPGTYTLTATGTPGPVVATEPNITVAACVIQGINIQPWGVITQPFNLSMLFTPNAVDAVTVSHWKNDGTGTPGTAVMLLAPSSITPSVGVWTATISGIPAGDYYSFFLQCTLMGAPVAKLNVGPIKIK